MSMVAIACVIWLCASVFKSVRLAFMHAGIVTMPKSIRRRTIFFGFIDLLEERTCVLLRMVL